MSNIIQRQRTKFRHNPKSKLTKYIYSLPISGLCQECTNLIKWKKDHRRYKPLTVPRRCDACSEKEVKEAYHTICRKCSEEKHACAKCLAITEE